jgi:hypothetical protein
MHDADTPAPPGYIEALDLRPGQEFLFRGHRCRSLGYNDCGDTGYAVGLLLSMALVSNGRRYATVVFPFEKFQRP